MNTPAALMGMIASEAAEESLKDALERIDWKARALAAETAKLAVYREHYCEEDPREDGCPVCADMDQIEHEIALLEGK